MQEVRADDRQQARLRNVLQHRLERGHGFGRKHTGVDDSEFGLRARRNEPVGARQQIGDLRLVERAVDLIQRPGRKMFMSIA